MFCEKTKCPSRGAAQGGEWWGREEAPPLCWMLNWNLWCTLYSAARCWLNASHGWCVIPLVFYVFTTPKHILKQVATQYRLTFFRKIWKWVLAWLVCSNMLMYTTKKLPPSSLHSVFPLLREVLHTTLLWWPLHRHCMIRKSPCDLPSLPFYIILTWLNFSFTTITAL